MPNEIPGGAAQEPNQPINSISEETLHGLENQGFTEEEALRLIAVTGRLEDSPEAREETATLHRLRFTRWLVEQGKMDEWSI